jgi:small subunit ribosomal protein S12
MGSNPIFSVRLEVMQKNKLPTYNQLLRKPRIAWNHKKMKKLLQGSPQKRAVCIKARIMKPKKPNSAQRKVARVRLLSLRRSTTVAIPGQGHNVQQYSVVLLRGGRVRDLPGVRYKIIRGVYDVAGVSGRNQRRSKFGVRRLKPK